MKTHMPSGPTISGERLYGEISPNGNPVVRLSGPQYSRGENYFTEFSGNPSQLTRNLELNKQRMAIQKQISLFEGITPQELKESGFAPELVNEFFPQFELES